MVKIWFQYFRSSDHNCWFSVMPRSMLMPLCQGLCKFWWSKPDISCLSSWATDLSSWATDFPMANSKTRTMLWESYEDDRQHDKEHIGAQSKNLSDLWQHTSALTLHFVVGKVVRAYARVRAHMHHWLIWYQGSSCTTGCAIVHSKTQPACREPTKQNSTHNLGLGNLDCSGDSAWFLAFMIWRHNLWSQSEHDAVSRMNRSFALYAISPKEELPGFFEDSLPQCC